MNDAPTTPVGGALVVGAGSGIGRAVAEHFARGGIPTVAADLNPAATKELASRHDGIVTVGDDGWDATDPEACDRLVEETVRPSGPWTAWSPLSAGPPSLGSSRSRPTIGARSWTST